MATKPLIILARYKFLLLVPFLVILPVAIVFSIAMRKTSYQSTSTVWVDPPLFVPIAQQSGYNGYLSPAQNEAIVANELLATNAFTEKVAAAISKPTLPITRDMVRYGTSVYANGVYSLVVRHSDKDGRVPAVIVAGVVKEIHDQYVAKVKEDAALAYQIYKGEAPALLQARDEASKNLADYLAQHRDTSANDPQLIALQSASQRAQDAYDANQRAILNLVNTSGTTELGYEKTIEIVDQASAPAVVKPSKRSLLAEPTGGLLLAISLAAAMYTFLLRTDNSIRVAEDLQALPGLALLGNVPDVTSVRKRGWPKHFFRLAVTGLGVTIQS